MKNPRITSDWDRELGRKIQQLRVSRGMSQESLGKMVGVTFQQIQKYEQGVNRIAASRLEQVAGALHVPVSFFYGGGVWEDIEQLIYLEGKLTLRLLRAYCRIGSAPAKRRAIAMIKAMAGN